MSFEQGYNGHIYLLYFFFVLWNYFWDWMNQYMQLKIELDNVVQINCYTKKPNFIFKEEKKHKMDIFIVVSSNGLLVLALKPWWVIVSLKSGYTHTQLFEKKKKWNITMGCVQVTIFTHWTIDCWFFISVKGIGLMTVFYSL